MDVSTFILSILLLSYNSGFLVGPIVNKDMQVHIVATSSYDSFT